MEMSQNGNKIGFSKTDVGGNDGVGPCGGLTLLLPRLEGWLLFPQSDLRH